MSSSSRVFSDVFLCLRELHAGLQSFHQESVLDDARPPSTLFSSWDHTLIPLPRSPPILSPKCSKAWKEIHEYYHSLLTAYEEIGMIFLHEKRFWTLALKALLTLETADGMGNAIVIAKKHVSRLSAPILTGQDAGRPFDLSKYRDEESGVFTELNRTNGSLKHVHFIFRNLNDESNKRLLCVLKAFERVRDSSAYLTPIDQHSCISDERKGSERGPFGVSVKLDKGSEQLSTFLEREHDIPLFQRQKMGSSLLNSVIELVKEVRDETVVNGLTRDCVIVSNATQWREAQTFGNDYVSPRLKISIPWEYVAHGGQYDTRHVRSGISVLLFEIMSLNPWKKSYPPMKEGDPLKDVSEVEFPVPFRKTISSLEAKRVIPNWLLLQACDEWEFHIYSHVTDVIPMLYRAMMVSTEKALPHHCHMYCKSVSYVGETLCYSKIDEKHPLRAMLAKLNNPNILRNYTILELLLKLSREMGCLLPHCLMAALGEETAEEHMHTIITRDVRSHNMHAAEPLSYLLFALLNANVDRRMFMHAYVDAIKMSPRGLGMDGFLPLYSNLGINFEIEASIVMGKFMHHVIRPFGV
jgi:hypothetical protein